MENSLSNKQETEHTHNEIGTQISYIEMVKQFHKAFGVAINPHPELASNDDFILRLDLLEEELSEMRDAILHKVDMGKYSKDTNKWKIDLLDALCDLQYVLSGAIIQLGFGKVFNEAFKAVHESNMSKIIKDKHSVELEMYEYKKNGTPCVKEMVKDGWVIKRSSDGKILKPSGYRPVDLSVFLEVLNDA